MDERLVQNFHHENNQKVRNSCCVSFLRIIYQILVKHVVGGGAVHEHRRTDVVLQVPFELGGSGTAHRLAHAGLGHAPAGTVVCHQHPDAVPTATNAYSQVHCLLSFPS